MLIKILIVALVGGIIITTLVLNYNQTTALTNIQPVEQKTPSPAATNEPKKINPVPSQKSQITAFPTASPKVEVKTDASGETTVEISEEVLNNQIKSSLVGQSMGSTPLGETTITDATIKINNGFLLISGAAKSGFVTLPFQMKAILELKDGKPKLDLSDLSLNSIPLPQIIADQLTNVIQNKVNDIINSYNFKLKSLTLETGKIILVGEK